MNAQSYIKELSQKDFNSLEQVVEFAFQFNVISSQEYREWQETIRNVEAKKTEQLLKVLVA
ncbi:hypothetical protein F3J02_01400 [Acinetobacter sp. Tr-809]|uniref:hypothetical protein n=1 Tax=Acinetobacter sp. Tr-809 TaxID=2608324 RepID=UPI001424A62F|nr:hypothetical protein [Acinetobacter sp. Tr-809]NIE95150.1 hypothetical protein [Acinetobacter sp. Tr-809]